MKIIPSLIVASFALILSFADYRNKNNISCIGYYNSHANKINLDSFVHILIQGDYGSTKITGIVTDREGQVNNIGIQTEYKVNRNNDFYEFISLKHKILSRKKMSEKAFNDLNSVIHDFYYTDGISVAYTIIPNGSRALIFLQGDTPVFYCNKY